MGTLYIVATPIGNLEDITARALRILAGVNVIAAEDTRHTGHLLRHFGIDTPTLSYHAHNAATRKERILAELALGDVALVTDAGTPAISDPGNEIVRAAAAAGYRVEPVPGPSSLAAALSVSGLAEGPVLFVGFLPRERQPRQRELARIAAARCTAVLFEAPTRLASTLADLEAVLGPAPAAVARELTKVHEEIRRGSLADLRAWASRERPKGEMAIVVGVPDQGDEPPADDLPTVIGALRSAGMSASQAAREASRITGLPRDQTYAAARAWSPGSAAGAGEGIG